MKQMLIRVRPLMKKMAILCDGDPVEFAYTCEGCEQTMGSIYKGRVDSVLPGMDAAFVDIGLRRCAFLHFCDAGRCGGASGDSGGGHPRRSDARASSLRWRMRLRERSLERLSA